MSDETTRDRSIARFHAFLDLLSAKDMVAWNDLWAENAVQEMPYSPAGFPRRIDGKAALVRHYSNLPASTGMMVFTGRVIHSMVDPNVVFAEYQGDIEILATGKHYNNRYAGLFGFDTDGKLILFREYFDPNVLTEAWEGSLTNGFRLRKP